MLGLPDALLTDSYARGCKTNCVNTYCYKSHADLLLHTNAVTEQEGAAGIYTLLALCWATRQHCLPAVHDMMSCCGPGTD